MLAPSWLCCDARCQRLSICSHYRVQHEENEDHVVLSFRGTTQPVTFHISVEHPCLMHKQPN